MNKKFSSLFIALVILAMTVSPSIAPVMSKKPVVTDGDGYTQYVGTLGGANFVVRIPDEEDWNGMLVVGCHGYMMNWNPNAQFAMDKLGGVGLPFALVEQGFAYAASSYGEGGFPIKEAMIRTHQLTEYVIDNFGVTGKVFLIGFSMGGAITLRLGEKYPELYDGVLDISGMRDIVMGYNDSIMGIDQIESIPEDEWDLIPQPVKNQILATLALLKQMTADMEAQYGGTYDDKPQHYERLNPVDNAEISIPMISVTGAQDQLSTNQVHTFENAVAEAGCSEYYQLYIVPAGDHANPPTINAALSHFAELVNYPDGW
ncbi:alpha/beta hydrolase family protein [Thermoproteota archaeon]